MAIIDKPTDFFNTKLYTGNDGTQSVTGVGFKPDWIWIKTRAQSNNSTVFDIVRGVTKRLRINQSNAENTSSGVTSFNSDGFTVGSDSAGNSGTMVAWNWKAGTSFTNDASGTGIGTIDSAGSFNDTSGFSIVTYTGNGSSGASVKHGMNQKPAMLIVKDRDASNEGWLVYHQKLGATKYLRLNETGAAASGSAYWNNTLPTSSVFTIGNNDVINKSGDDYVGYCFAEKPGYSKFGEYRGNSSDDGTFVYTGFKTAFVIFRRSSASSSNWVMQDNKRVNFSTGTNENSYSLKSNTDAAEVTNESEIDLLSNGFKFRNAITDNNADGSDYIYMAFAENPFVTSTTTDKDSIPATAR